MQTFLPYPDFQLTAKTLDYRRLGKQRVEAKQILMTLRGESSGWQHHPAVKMWAGHEASLAFYGMTMCIEWKARGYEDNLYSYFSDIFMAYVADGGTILDRPAWTSDPRVHLSHKSNLIRKDPVYYRPLFGDDLPDDMPYFWPTNETERE